ncbi:MULTISPECIES: pilus assembly protein [unclassified Acidovorax]|uniref:pilus assembly protein n=1 Tax=unclassified Acidovorax TaxID=2684926 RepID=UPI000ABD336B|nr:MULTISPECIES: PilC/PilY family type IV pilus protein [unclassified Acidovorax]PUA97751.1 type IV pilus assembly protein PilY1 [Acidovorax sp. 107]
MSYSITQNLYRWAITATAALVALPALAQYSSDIDIYSGTGSGSTSNVLFVLDSSANWNASLKHTCVYSDGTGAPSKGQTKGGMEQCAIYNAIEGLQPNADGSAPFNIGFMIFNETNVDTGARVIKALTPLTSAGKTELKNFLKTLDQNQSPSPTSYALAMHEAYLYFSQKTPFSGQRAGTLPYDPNAFSGGKYVLPAGSDCGRNYLIIIANGPPQGDQMSNDVMKAMLATAGGSVAPITYAAGTVDPKDAANWTDEYARFVNGVDRTAVADGAYATTHTIAVTGAPSDKATYPEIFRGIAKVGGGDFYTASNSTALSIALGEVFSQLQAANSVFSSASLPVSANARGSYLNQIFMGMFRPDGDAKPRWRGNLKQYKFTYDPTTDSIALADANGDGAISSATGFIKPSAVSYWTAPSSFWVNQPLGTPPNVADKTSDSPDGDIVEKGGIAQQIRTTYATSQSARKLYTCIGCSTNTNLATNTSTQFTTANSSSMAGISTDSTQRDLIINWVRGTDNAGDEKGPGGTTTIRPSAHGDVLHSRPAVVNYGTDASPNIVVFYGSNDGTLRAVNGNQSGTGAGQELWGFIPQEHFGKLQRLRNNSPEVRLSTTTVLSSATNPPTTRDYFVDGPISVYQTSSKVYLYFAMRRGGRFLYALDVTDPAQPKFLWKKANTDTGFGSLGQTWSEPRIAKIKGSTDPVIVMGAGYDASAEDVTPVGTTSMGNAILVLNALTGDKIAQFNTDRSVPADVTLVDSDSDGYIDRAYAVDLGGNIYRIDFETSTSTAISEWGIYKLAALKGSGTRKFFYAPDVVMYKAFAAVQAGSGDREKPLDKTSSDAFFTVLDKNPTKGTLSGFTPVVPSNLGLVGTTDSKVNGCFINMSTAGEKIVNAPLTFLGTTYFGTNMPAPPKSGICSANLGEAKSYSVPLLCQTPTVNKFIGGGLPPSPIAGFTTVTYSKPNGDGTSTEVKVQTPFISGTAKNKPAAIEFDNPKLNLNMPRKRTYWYQEKAR